MPPHRLLIRPLRPDEWMLFRDLRIRAVTDTPDAFGAVPDEVVRRSDDEWRNFTAGFASDGHVLLVGFVADEAVGTTYARLNDDGTGHIGAMWIDPRHRRGGLGQLLLRAGIDWILAQGAPVVQLW
jgi:GNAT superfamily N-acetyltransferase